MPLFCSLFIIYPLSYSSSFILLWVLFLFTFSKLSQPESIFKASESFFVFYLYRAFCVLFNVYILLCLCCGLFTSGWRTFKLIVTLSLTFELWTNKQTLLKLKTFRGSPCNFIFIQRKHWFGKRRPTVYKSTKDMLPLEEKLKY